MNTNDNLRPSQYSKNGMVATSQPLASQAGLDILKKGGNAVDAAIATAACLTVVEPTSNGMGSDAFAIVWMNNEIYGLNSSGPAPMSVKVDNTTMPMYGWTPITVPGAPAAWSALSERFGKLSLTECLAPAISYAEEGYPVSPVVAHNWRRAYEIYSNELKGDEFAEWFRVFAPDGRTPQAGEMWSSRDHAASLREIAETKAESFYRGALAEKIVAASKSAGKCNGRGIDNDTSKGNGKNASGFFELSDLANFVPEWVTPISVNYNGYDVWELPPNGQGLVALMALKIMDGFDVGTQYNTDVYHKQLEAIKLAFASGMEYITDPKHMKIPVSDLLSDTYINDLRGSIKNTASLPEPIRPKSGGTVYLASADGDGNMVSYIQSNYLGFGSGIVIPGTGISMQNRGYDFSLDPGHANFLQGGKRTYHTIIPGFLTKRRQPIGPFGVMGGYMQPQGHVQVLMNMINFGMSPQAALDAPRWQWISGNRVDIEADFPRQTAYELAGCGHDINIQLSSGQFGRGQIIQRNPDTGVLTGGTEPRADGGIAMW